MAIQFPPQSINDPKPIDGETYLYLVTQEEFVYDAAINAWSPLGKSDGSAFAFIGTVFVKQPAPSDAEIGYIYSVADGANSNQIDPSFNGLYNAVDVQQWNLIIYDGSKWQLVSSPAGPWLRTSGGNIQPIIATDSIDMVDGDYVIESLPDLP